jgi:hypothetical protein
LQGSRFEPACANNSEDPIFKITKPKWIGDVEHMLSKCETKFKHQSHKKKTTVENYFSPNLTVNIANLIYKKSKSLIDLLFPLEKIKIYNLVVVTEVKY